MPLRGSFLVIFKDGEPIDWFNDKPSAIRSGKYEPRHLDLMIHGGGAKNTEDGTVYTARYIPCEITPLR